MQTKDQCASSRFRTIYPRPDKHGDFLRLPLKVDYFRNLSREVFRRALKTDGEQQLVTERLQYWRSRQTAEMIIIGSEL